MKKILYIASHRINRAPGQRFRLEQYFDFLEKNGYHCELSYFITERDDRNLYMKGHYPHKLWILLKAMMHRFGDLRKLDNYDAVYIHREALPIGSVFFERRFSKSNAKMIFDFDDSIFLPDTSDANKKLTWLKNPRKTDKIIAMSDVVFAGNKYLAQYASQFNDNVKVVPTTINTKDVHKKPEQVKKDNTICIGWTGSITTIKHFEYAIPVLRKIKEKYGDKVSIKVIGDENYENKELGIKGTAWSSDNEIEELSKADIGIMPLPNDEWSKGKCGLKCLQYMALEIPPVVSPVGVNTEIIKDGVNGYIADSDEEWFEKIGRLIESGELRQRMGKEACKTVEEKYSTDSQKAHYLACLNELFGKSPQQ